MANAEAQCVNQWHTKIKLQLGRRPESQSSETERQPKVGISLLKKHESKAETKMTQDRAE